MTNPAIQRHGVSSNNTPKTSLRAVYTWQEPTGQPVPAKTKKIRILSLDGGGIKGILPATILEYIEEELQARTNNSDVRISDYFDFFAGTSTGGILVCSYLCPDKNGRPAMTAKQALELYEKYGGEIFKASFFRKVRTLAGFANEKYNAFSLEKLLKNKLGKIKLSQALKPCMITAYDIQNRKAKFFTSVQAQKDTTMDFNLWKVARATSAAPTYFEPAKIKSVDKTTELALVDGGLFANNPAMCAYSEARKTNFSEALDSSQKPNLPSAKDMMIVSIGTGSDTESIEYNKMKDRGKLLWIEPVIDMLMSGNAETVKYQMEMMFQTLEKDNRDYYRINPYMGRASSEMDDVSKKNIAALIKAGKQNIERLKPQLDNIIDKLIEHH